MTFDQNLTVSQVFETFTEAQKSMVLILSRISRENIKDSDQAKKYINKLDLPDDINGRTVQEVFDSLTELQKQTV